MEMFKEYVSPEVEIIFVDNNDVVTASGDPLPGTEEPPVVIDPFE